MSGPSVAPKRPRRLWLTIGEVVGLLALVIAGLNYWESHSEHKASEKHAAAAGAFILTGQAESGGRRVALHALRAEQAIQSQRFIFPSRVLDHPEDVTAATPRIEDGWVAPGLGRTLDSAHAKGEGEALLPVGVITTYVEDGETRTDQSLYRVGYAWRSRLLLGRQITLQGISLERRGVSGDLQALVNQRWSAGG